MFLMFAGMAHNLKVGKEKDLALSKRPCATLVDLELLMLSILKLMALNPSTSQSMASRCLSHGP